ncbi:hypothetical protein GQ44DRAFT_187156 [Phaeosphaeriaceae sp. PMI808]|nr:hypothetical protein GQ44DRAFT_187156 [Phaeosphaeriaceae sp. PMI808]
MLPHGQPPITTTGFTFSLDNVPNTWSLVDLYGCTSVIVLSRKRMFMTHIWEGPTMITPQNLQTQVLDSLRNGDAGVPHGLSAFVGPGGHFENTLENKVRAFIITPYRRGGPINPLHDDIQFPYEVGKIKDLLNNVLGRSDTTTIPYFATGPDDLFEVPNGKVLIQYDPVAVWLGRADGSCNTQIAGIELWFEDYPMYRYRDRWDAFQTQLIPANTLPRRSIFSISKDIRQIGGREGTANHENEWNEYEYLMKRQDGRACPIRRQSDSASSTAPPASASTPSPSNSPVSSKPLSAPSSLLASLSATTPSFPPSSVSPLSSNSLISSASANPTTFQTSFISSTNERAGFLSDVSPLRYRNFLCLIALYHPHSYYPQSQSQPRARIQLRPFPRPHLPNQRKLSQ